MHDQCDRCHDIIKPDVKPGQHVCADVAKRHARRAAQRDAVLVIMNERRHELEDWDFEDVAEAIVEKLAHMGVDRE